MNTAYGFAAMPLLCCDVTHRSDIPIAEVLKEATKNLKLWAVQHSTDLNIELDFIGSHVQIMHAFKKRNRRVCYRIVGYAWAWVICVF